MTHDTIRAAIDRKAKEAMVSVPLASLMALIEERDSLERDLCMEREIAQINRSADGFKTFEVTAVECTCTAPPTTHEFTTIERADGSIEGGWVIQDGDEMVTVTVDPCSVQELTARAKDFVEAMPSTLEQAVCGSRMPIGQVVESPAPLPVLKEKPFVADKGKGKPSETVVPWRAGYTPNQCRLVLQCLTEGMHRVTAAAKANVTRETVNDIAKAYRVQIEHMAGMSDKEREHFLESLYRQMLARWVAAGNDPKYQPEAPLPNKTITEAAGTYKTKGKAGKL